MSGSNLTIVASGTYIKGHVFSEDSLIVEGGVEGDVLGNRVVIKTHGWVYGNVTCRSLSIENGGIVEGWLRISAEPSAPALDEDRATEALPPGKGEEGEMEKDRGGGRDEAGEAAQYPEDQPDSPATATASDN